jgi:hypothetical protein
MQKGVKYLEVQKKREEQQKAREEAEKKKQEQKNAPKASAAGTASVASDALPLCLCASPVAVAVSVAVPEPVLAPLRFSAPVFPSCCLSYQNVCLHLCSCLHCYCVVWMDLRISRCGSAQAQLRGQAGRGESGSKGATPHEDLHQSLRQGR